MNWQTEYQSGDFVALFTTEQEYIDAAFMLIILYNWGIWLNVEDMLNTFTQ